MGDLAHRSGVWFLAIGLAAVAGPVPGQVDAAISRLAAFENHGDRQPLHRIATALAAVETESSRRAWAQGLLRVIGGDQVSAGARRFAADQLLRIAGDAEVDGLVGLLPSPVAGLLAAEVLVAVPGAIPAEAIRTAMPNPKLAPAVRLRLIESLGRHQDVRAVPLLRPYLLVRDFDLFRGAVQALGRIPTPVAERVLARAAVDAVGQRRSASARAWMCHGERRSSLGEIASAAAIFRQFTGATEVRALRLVALRGLARVLGAAAYPELARVLRDRDRKVGELAAQEIPRLPGIRLEGRGAELLGASRRTGVRVILIEGLIARGNPDAMEFFEGVLAQPRAGDPAFERADERAAALRGLAALGGAGSVPVLVRYLATAGRRESRAIEASLVGMPGPEVDRAIGLGLASTTASIRVRRVLVGILARRGSRAAAAVLATAATGDRAFPVRLAAWRGLVDHPQALSLDSALEALRTRRAVQERGLIETVAANRVRAAGARSILRLRAVLESRGPEGRRSLLAILAQVGGKAAAETVEAMLEPAPGTSSELPGVALAALVDWPDFSASAALLRFARATSDAGMRRSAVDGYLGLVARHRPGSAARWRTGWAIARRDAARNLVLRQLAACGDRSDLGILGAGLENSGTREAAGVAIVALVEDLPPAKRSGLGGLLRKILEQVQDPEVRRRALRLLWLLGE